MRREIAFLICLVIMAAGCSPNRRHAVLTFFFDGVPPLGDPAAGSPTKPRYSREEAIARAVRIEMQYHKPYQENQCTKCHADRNALSVDDRGRRTLCWSCHEHDEFKVRLQARPFLHGPVAVENCSACHDPHESVHSKLLLQPDPKLCYSCHDRETTLAGTHHANLEKELCLTCHDPHGGSNRFFILAGTARTSPPTEAR